MKNKNITIEDLARMVGKGFDSMDKGFNNVDRRFDGVDKKKRLEETLAIK